jgi:hypothetical protein
LETLARLRYRNVRYRTGIGAFGLTPASLAEGDFEMEEQMSRGGEADDREAREAAARVGPRPSDTLLTVAGRDQHRAWLRSVALEAPPAAKASLLQGLMRLIEGPPSVEGYAARIAMLQIADWMEEDRAEKEGAEELES